MSSVYSIINGEFVLKNESAILISDLAIQRGYGIFDYFRTIKNDPVFLVEHLNRFYFSASEMFMDPGYTREELKGLIKLLIEKNNIADSGIRLTLTGGYSEDGYSPATPNLLITQTAFSFNRDNFNKGIKLITFPYQRQLPHVKTIDYLMAIHLQKLIKEKGADDVLYYHNNEITECPRANVFFINKNEEVLTPSKNILSGITRKKILGFPEFNTRESIIKLSDVPDFREVFICSTTKNVLPVLAVDGKIIGDGKPGEITRKIYEDLLSIKEK
ncbi:MAG: aminotransferase class IV [Ginsengibacter sp.]